jgi:hypothetical protein
LGNVPATVIGGHADRPDNGIERVPPFVLVTTSVALLLPRLVGWKVTVVVVSPPGASVVDAGVVTVNTAASAPVMANVAGAVDPDSTEPKSNEVGETEMPGRPVPLNATVAAPLLELVTATDALFAPVASGWKVTAIVAVPAAANVVVDGGPRLNDEASGPLTTAGTFKVTDVSRRFLMVTVCARASGGMTPPKSMLAGALVSTMFCGFGRLGELNN